jgi:hypothetical protein
MSTMSLLAVDHSDRLARRFAAQASSFIERPDEAQSDAAKIPLENLFRLLQMFKYDAFSDEPRSGVLEFRPLTDQREFVALENEWQAHILAALRKAIQEVFGELPKEHAVNEVQSALTWLATNSNEPPVEVRDRAKAFFNSFVQSL